MAKHQIKKLTDNIKKLIDKIKDYCKKEGSITKIIIAAAIVVAVIVIILIFLFAGNNKSQKIDVIELPVASQVTQNSDDSENNVDFDTLLPDRKYSKEDKEVDIPIENDYFVAGIFELRGNYKTNGYLGQTVSIEGQYSEFTPDGSNVVYHNVYRMAVSEELGEDNAQNCGIEFVWDGDYPKAGDWIKVVGVLRAYEEGGIEYLTIDAISVDIMDTPGSLYVYY